MDGPTSGLILTESKWDVLRGDYGGTRQAKYDHWQAIFRNIRRALADFRRLSRHMEQKRLEQIFREGHGSTDGPVPRQEHNRDPFGWNSLAHLSEYVDEEGRPVPSEFNPDARPRLKRMMDRIEGPNKASPETQEALIESVAFICRAAEAGELNVDQLIAQGVERYYQNSSTKEGHLVTLEKWPEEQWGGILARAHERGKHNKDTTPAPTQAEIRYLERDGFNPMPD